MGVVGIPLPLSFIICSHLFPVITVQKSYKTMDKLNEKIFKKRLTNQRKCDII